MERQENIRNLLEGFSSESIQQVLETIPGNASYEQLTAKQKLALDIAASMKAQQLLRQQQSDLSMLEELPPSDDDGPPDDRLSFNWNNISKKEIFSMILSMERQGGFCGKMSNVLRFFAKRTNLGKEDTIHSQYYGYKKDIL